MARKIIVLGAGFSGLSTAAYLARQGFKVEILEKNLTPGGRARKIEADGFTFDMGPSWYWMPEVFVRFFAHFDTHTSNYYELVKLDPSFRVFFDKDNVIDVPFEQEGLCRLFESIEPGSCKRLKVFLKESKKKCKIGMNNMIFKPGLSITEYLNPKLVTGLMFTKSLCSYSSYVRSMFKDIRLIRLLEFPMIFLGGIPSKIPAFYSMLNYATIEQGIWYPMGGMHKVVEAMAKVCNNFGVDITYNVNIDQFDVLKGRVSGAHTGHRNFYAEYFVSTADYQHTDQKLLSNEFSNYSAKYWDKRVMTPSALIFYIGLNKKIPNLLHHNLLFDTDFEKHTQEIYKNPKWPNKPVIFVTVTSKTDASVAPEGHENLVVLIPVAPGLVDHGKVREHYFDIVIKRLENICGEDIRNHIVFHKSYAHADYVNDYNSFKGNAYGLANTLKQSGPFKPKIMHRNLPNLFYAGHLTVPGAGVPLCIIGGEIVAKEIYKASGGRKS